MERLAQTLSTLGDEMPPARLPDDLWRHGRRQRRGQRLRAAAIAVVVVGLLTAVSLVLPVRRGGLSVAGGDDTVPGSIGVPWMWQATVQQDPRGPATLMFSGYGWGLRGNDVFDAEGKNAVVGADGSYRMLLSGGVEQVAGEHAVLSPDGRHVASAWLTDAGKGWLTITDLTTGTNRSYRHPDGWTCCTEPVAWRPDGAALLVLDYRSFDPDTGRFDPVTHEGVVPTRLLQFDLATGRVTPLEAYPQLYGVRRASLAAYSPDGHRIAVTVGQQVRVFDGSGKVLWTARLGPRRFLAGPGAFSSDGRRIATVELEGCLDDCDRAQLSARRWRFGYLDAATGADSAGAQLAPVTGIAVRTLGWRAGTDAVVVVYQDASLDKTGSGSWNDTDYWNIGHAALLALRPDGSTETLLDPPPQVSSLDVPRQLVEAGRFGGPRREPQAFPARAIIAVPVIGMACPVLIVFGVAVLFWRVRRRR